MSARSHTKQRRRERRRFRTFAAAKAAERDARRQQERHDVTEWLPVPMGFHQWCRTRAELLERDGIAA